MRIFHSFEELGEIRQPIHWAAGFFDGVHCGHRRVIESACTRGALRGALTFDPHPLAVLCPGKQPDLLTPDAVYKALLLEEIGVDVMLALPFTNRLSTMGAREFLSTLCQACHVVGISVGANWHFGKGAEGDAAFLHKEAASLGFRPCINGLVKCGEETVCSSRIRALLAEGRLELAVEMLGHPFCIAGTVEHGRRLARRLGFPTANIALPPHAALPHPGVYEAQAFLDGISHQGIANIGVRPTVDAEGGKTWLEAHFLNWNGDLYGRRLTVEIKRFIRPERRFPSIEALGAQIRHDLAALQSHSPLR